MEIRHSGHIHLSARFSFLASFAVIFMPGGHNVPIHLRANRTLTAQIADHCASRLFYLRWKSRNGTWAQWRGDSHRTVHAAAGARGPRGWK